MNRRQLLATLAAAGAVGAAGCGGGGEESETTPPTAPPTDTTAAPSSSSPTETATATPGPTVEAPSRYAGRFDTVVDVTRAGADPTGSESVAGVLSDLAADDTLLVFPPGRYRLPRLVLDDLTNAGLVADPPGSAALVPSKPGTEIANRFLQFRDVREFVLDGLTFDYTTEGHGGAVMVLSRGDFVVRDVQIRGQIPDRHRPDHPAAYRFDVLEKGARGLVERAVARDGGHNGGNAVGVFVGKDHAGELVFSECDIQHFPNNGLYASAPGRASDSYHGADGVVHVRGGLYRNNNIANVRLGSTGSTARGVRVVVDEVPPHYSEARLNVRGIRLRGQHGQVVEDCDVVFGPDAGPGFGAIVVHSANAKATVRNTTVRMDRDGVPAIKMFEPSGNGPFGTVFENVSVTGSAADDEAVLVTGRDGVEFRNCTVEQTGTDRAGMLFVHVRGGRVVDTTIDVTGDPIQTVGSSVEQTGVTVVEARAPGTEGTR